MREGPDRLENGMSHGRYKNERVKTYTVFDISHCAGGIFNEPLLPSNCGMRAMALVKETPNFVARYLVSCAVRGNFKREMNAK